MSKRKLLLADDSVTVQKVVNLAFESEDIEVITADNGVSAFEKFVEFAPDLVMADINLPGANGYEICERIKQDEETKHIPVVLLVGSFVPFSEEKAERVGANGFLKKPFQSIGLLINKVTELLGMGDEEDYAASENDPSEADTQPMPTYKPSENDYSMSDDFGETGMDDEMIETERVADYSFADETAKYETNTGFDSDTEENSGKTQPMTDSEVEELGLTDQEEQTSEETVYELADEPDDYSSADFYESDAETETRTPEESSANQADSYEEYSAYRQTKEAEKGNFPAPETASILNLDDFELLELPPLGAETSPAFDQISETNQADSLQEETVQAKTDYSDSAETTAEDSYSIPQTAQTTEETYHAPSEETTSHFNSSETQAKDSEISSETMESEIAKFAKDYYAPEAETETVKVQSAFEDESSAIDFEESTPQYFAEEEIETQPETDSETQALIAQETQQEISRASDNKVIVHYLPPEVIDEIAERVVEKLAEKLRR